MTHEEMDALIASGKAQCYECEADIDTTDKENYHVICWFGTKDCDIRCLDCWYREKYDVNEPELDYNDLD